MTRSEADVFLKIRRQTQERHAREVELTVLALLPHIGRDRDAVLESTDSTCRDRAIAASVLTRIDPRERRTQWLILTDSADRVAQIGEQFERWLEPNRGIRVGRFGEAARPSTEARSASAEPHVILATTSRLIDHIRRDNVDLSTVGGWIIDSAGPAAGMLVDLELIATKLTGRQTTFVFDRELDECAQQLEQLLTRPALIKEQEWSASVSDPGPEQREERSMKNRELPFDEKEMADRLKAMIRQIHEEEDPDELNQYRRVVNKNVSLFARGYLAAYLLKYSDDAARPRRRPSTGSAKPSRERGRSRDERKKRDSAPQEEENGAFMSIFVSIGRNRRVRSGDLTTLFTSADGIAESDLGQIKVLDNYSFVEVSRDKAAEAIERLNGTEFRGRKLTVNYARKK